MKLGLVFALLSLAACAKTASAPAPKAPVAATPEDCNKVYDNLLTLAVKSSDEEFTPEQVPAAKTVLDLMWRADGHSELFFNSCLNTANNAQTDCMAKATSFEGLKWCAKLYDTSKKTKGQ